ncbi:hypothetical protein BGZ63DRAFT_509386 [Mariannaea sp. PMI_226]|nr:hypothetical protein BGZ63DRAFT_509386 [Mariannaea sp. PMI_226]
MSLLWGLVQNRFSAPTLQSLNDNSTSFSGKTVLVTGASGGLGLEAARHYVRLGASRVILGVRSQSEGDEAVRNIRSTFTSDRLESCVIEVWLVDLSSFSSVQEMGKKIMQDLKTLDIAVLNAAVAPNEHHLTTDGWEEALQVNVLSTVLLALLILPKMRQSSLPDWKPRLSIVAARAHASVPEGLAWQKADSSLSYLNQASQFGGPVERYSVSKLLIVYAVRELAKLVTLADGESEVVVNYLCPGACKSDLSRNWQGLSRRVIFYLIQVTICKTTEEGARTLVYATGLGQESHGLWIHNNRIEEPGLLVRNDIGQKLQEKVWAEILGVLTPYSAGGFGSI